MPGHSPRDASIKHLPPAVRPVLWGKDLRQGVLEPSIGGLVLQQKSLSQGWRQSPSSAGLGRESLLANHPGSDATGGLECDLNTKGRLCALGVSSPHFPVIAESRVPAEPAIWAARVLSLPGGLAALLRSLLLPQALPSAQAGAQSPGLSLPLFRGQLLAAGWPAPSTQKLQEFPALFSELQQQQQRVGGLMPS